MKKYFKLLLVLILVAIVVAFAVGFGLIAIIVAAVLLPILKFFTGSNINTTRQSGYSKSTHNKTTKKQNKSSSGRIIDTDYEVIERKAKDKDDSISSDNDDKKS